MRRITELLPRRKRSPRTVYVGSHEDKLSRLSAMRINPDDDARMREDVEGEKFRAPHLMRRAGKR